MDLEPIPETREAVDELDPPDDHLLDDLISWGRRVRDVVPDCVGFSLAGLEHGVTFTVAATSADVALLDPMQYLEGGPCVEAAEAERVLACDRDDFFSEEAWRLFARATAGVGVASSLTLPILAEDRVVGTVNLYGASPESFAGRHEEVAGVFSAWAPGAVTNADLSFDSRRAAEEAPAELRARHKVSAAIGILAASERLSLDEADAAIRRSARRAGVAVTELADAIIAVERQRTDRQ